MVTGRDMQLRICNHVFSGFGAEFRFDTMIEIASRMGAPTYFKAPVGVTRLEPYFIGGCV